MLSPLKKQHLCVRKGSHADGPWAWIPLLFLLRVRGILEVRRIIENGLQAVKTFVCRMRNGCDPGFYERSSQALASARLFSLPETGMKSNSISLLIASPDSATHSSYYTVSLLPNACKHLLCNTRKHHKVIEDADLDLVDRVHRFQRLSTTVGPFGCSFCSPNFSNFRATDISVKLARALGGGNSVIFETVGKDVATYQFSAS